MSAPPPHSVSSVPVSGSGSSSAAASSALPSSFGVGVRSVSRARSSSLIVTGSPALKPVAVPASVADSSVPASSTPHRIKLTRSPLSTAFFDSRSLAALNKPAVIPSLSEQLLKRSRDAQVGQSSAAPVSADPISPAIPLSHLSHSATMPLPSKKSLNIWKACQVEFQAELRSIQVHASSSSKRRASIAELQQENRSRAERNPSLLPVLPRPGTLTRPLQHHSRIKSVAIFPAFHVSPPLDRSERPGGSEILKPLLNSKSLVRVLSPMGGKVDPSNFVFEFSASNTPGLSRAQSEERTDAGSIPVSPSPRRSPDLQPDSPIETPKKADPAIGGDASRSPVPVVDSFPTPLSRPTGSMNGRHLIPLDSHHRDQESEESEFEEPIVVDYSKLNAFFFSRQDSATGSSGSPLISVDAVLKEYVQERYQLQDLIGEGNFGSVWRAFPIALEQKKAAGNKESIAIKLQHGDRMTKGDAINELNIMAAVNEARERDKSAPGAKLVIHMLDHAYIEDENGDWSSFISMPMAFSSLAREKSDLSDAAMVLLSDDQQFAHLIAQGDAEVIEGTKTRNLAWSRLRRIAGLVLTALEWLHNNGFVHADLKPDNLLLVESESGSRSLDDCGLVLADFGLACTVSESCPELFFPGVVNTPAYGSPESWKGICGPSTDIFSFGITLLELATGFTPIQISLPEPRLFEAWSEAEVRQNAAQFARQHYSEFNYDESFLVSLYSSMYFAPDFLSFIQSCLNPSRFQRSTAGQLMQHKFLNP